MDLVWILPWLEYSRRLNIRGCSMYLHTASHQGNSRLYTKKDRCNTQVHTCHGNAKRGLRYGVTRYTTPLSKTRQGHVRLGKAGHSMGVHKGNDKLQGSQLYYSKNINITGSRRRHGHGGRENWKFHYPCPSCRFSGCNIPVYPCTHPCPSLCTPAPVIASSSTFFTLCYCTVSYVDIELYFPSLLYDNLKPDI
jgi:hypothetical protein